MFSIDCLIDFDDWPNVLFFPAQIKLVNINSSDIVDGNETVILGLIWTIILNFQVRRIFFVYFVRSFHIYDLSLIFF